MDELNHRPFRQLVGNRREAFEKLDQPALKPLPKHPYDYVEIRRCRVNIDYHIEFARHLYSVPHQYVGKQVEVQASDHLLQVFFRQRQVASHPRAHRPGTTTEAGHMPNRHRQHQQWTPARLQNWARDIGPHTLSLGDRPSEGTRSSRAGLPRVSRVIEPGSGILWPSAQCQLPYCQPGRLEPTKTYQGHPAEQPGQTPRAAALEY